jgi:GDP-L-fucose synthase
MPSKKKEPYHLNEKSSIFVSGHRGMVGSAIARNLKKKGFRNLITRTRKELDLLNQAAVNEFFDQEKPDVVILSAARVGGIKANMSFSAEFLYENLTIQSNVIHAAHTHGVKLFCFLSSSCIYPRMSPQPMKEECLLTGPLEPTNEGYAIAKLAGTKMIEHYKKQYGFPGFTLMPCNLYGTNDHFELDKSHVLSATVKKFVDAKINASTMVEMWGTGAAKREFMHVDDCAEAVYFFLTNNSLDTDFVNIGPGDDISIKELAAIAAEESGFDGEIRWDSSKPDGMPRKCMDVSRMKKLGFCPSIDLRNGVKKTIAEYRILVRDLS